MKGRSSVKWKQIKEGSKQFRKRDENDLFSFFFFPQNDEHHQKLLFGDFFPRMALFKFIRINLIDLEGENKTPIDSSRI